MQPRKGITVVTLEHAIAAPFSTRQLADLGARVIKIERPGSGDFARGYDGGLGRAGERRRPDAGHRVHQRCRVARLADDLRLLHDAGFTGAMLPKAESAQNIDAVLAAAPRVAVLVLVESARGVANAQAVAAARREPPRLRHAGLRARPRSRHRRGFGRLGACSVLPDDRDAAVRVADAGGRCHAAD